MNGILSQNKPAFILHLTVPALMSRRCPFVTLFPMPAARGCCHGHPLPLGTAAGGGAAAGDLGPSGSAGL